MPLADLFLVTQTVARLLDLNVRAMLRRQGLPTTLEVTTMPPERVGAATNTLNLHLYHLMEDAHYKNQPPPGRGEPPVARQPLVVMLYYILTAHHEINDSFDAEVQQRNFGLALKSLHDHPLIDDRLAISPDGGPPVPVMAQALQGRGNRIEIALRPLTPEESLAFWSAEQNATTRLSAYYEVRTIFFEPEPPTGAAGTVLDLGLFVSAGRAPVLERVAALSHFTPPAASGLPPQTLELAPARATLAPGLVPEVNRVRLSGSGLAGDGRPGSARIVLRNPAWRERVPPVRAAPLDPALNPAWAVAIDERSARFDLQGTLTVDLGAGPVALEVTPGIYAVSIEARRRQETPSGLVRTTTSESNQLAFSVGARIDGVDPPGALGRRTVRVVNLFDMTAAALETQLAVDGILYEEVADFAPPPADNRGLFRRLPGAVELQPLYDAAAPGAHPVRLVINGGESQPFWIVTP